MFDAIQSISISDILDKLSIIYTKKQGSLALWQDGKETDGWRANLSANYVNDFSMKDRAVGGPYAFVKKYLGLSDKETFTWFYNYFGIDGTGDKVYRKKKQVSHKLPVIRYLR